MFEKLSRILKISVNEVKERFNKLTKREQMYLRMMIPQYGVLYIKGKPGIAKSAIFKEIASKMGFEFIDMRLAMNDESDFKYPHLVERFYNGETINVSEFAVPEWAYRANKTPTLIVFEEINRAPLFVRNAALQILLDREIGLFKFNEGVFMASAGNLGDEDGTDVEELDSALNNRLIHIKHSLTIEEWIENYAKYEVHYLVRHFLDNHYEYFYKNPDENSDAYATARSWTMLSKFITENWGMDADPREFIPTLREVAGGYVGNSAMRFIRFCEETVNISIKDIIERYKDVKVELGKYNRDKKSELVRSLREVDIISYDINADKKKLKNIVEFLGDISAETRAAYLIFLLDDVVIKHSTAKAPRWILSQFREQLKEIKDLNTKNNNTDNK